MIQDTMHRSGENRLSTTTTLSNPLDPTAEPRFPRLWLAGTAAGILLGAVLLVAVWGKMLDPGAFAEGIHAQKLDFLLSAHATAFVALAIEAALGMALVLGVRRLWVLGPTALLVAFFVFLNGRAYWLAAHGVVADSASCGCFGNLVQRSPAAAFWQDLLLLVPPLVVAFLGQDRRAPAVPKARTAAVALATLLVLAFAWKAPDLPLDDLATRLKPGVLTKEICVTGDNVVCLDTLVPDLAKGDHLLVMADLDDPALTKAVPALNDTMQRPGGPTVWLLSAAPPKDQRAFFWKAGPAFKIIETPEALMRPLYRRLPRSFRVKDGRVTQTFAGLPPA
jgi:hypothetical protein